MKDYGNKLYQPLKLEALVGVLGSGQQERHRSQLVGIRLGVVATVAVRVKRRNR